MVYFDKSARRIFRPLRPTNPPTDPDLDDAKTRYVRQVAEKYPNFTPDEVYAEIRYGLHRNDITKAMVRKILAERRRTSSLWRFRR